MLKPSTGAVRRSLAADWREDPPPSSTTAIGDEWLKTGGMLALAVSSTIAVRDSNFLINPAQPAFTEVTGAAEELPLIIDQRLLVLRSDSSLILEVVEKKIHHRRRRALGQIRQAVDIFSVGHRVP